MSAIQVAVLTGRSVSASINLYLEVKGAIKKDYER